MNPRDYNIFEKRFFAAWIVAAIAMYGMSYLWHGVFLNDFQKISFPKDMLLMSFALIYSVLGFLLSLMVKFVMVQSSPSLKGFLLGIALGFFVYLIAFSLGISLYSNFQWKHVVFDLAWQMVEQGVGGFLAGSAYSLFTSFDRRSAF